MIHKKVFTSQKGLRSTGGPDLLKWGLPPGEGSNLLKCVAPTPYVYSSPVSTVKHSALPIRVERRLVGRAAEGLRPRLLHSWPATQYVRPSGSKCY